MMISLQPFCYEYAVILEPEQTMKEFNTLKVQDMLKSSGFPLTLYNKTMGLNRSNTNCAQT